MLLLLLLLLESLVSAHQDSGWQLPRPTSSRAYLHLNHPASWTQAEDRCQQLYGHLARDDSAGELREFMKREKIGGQVWIGLHQWAPADAFHWVDDFSWTDVDIPSSSIWGEYVEEYEMALCVSLDIDYGYRWDTRYCQGEEIAGSICQIEVPTWIHQENCNTSRLLHLWIKDQSSFNLKYFPDNETLSVECRCRQSVRKSTICSIDERFQEVLPLCCDDNATTQTTESTVSTQSFATSASSSTSSSSRSSPATSSSPERPGSTHDDYSTEIQELTTKVPVAAITASGKEKQTKNLQIVELTASQPEKYSPATASPEPNSTNKIIESSSSVKQDVKPSSRITSKPTKQNFTTSSPTNQDVKASLPLNQEVSESTAHPERSSASKVKASSDRINTTAPNTTIFDNSSSIKYTDMNTESPVPTSPSTKIGPTKLPIETIQRPKRQSQWLSTGLSFPNRKPDSQAKWRKSFRGQVTNRQASRG